MANCAGIPPGNFLPSNGDVQLFTKSGEYVTTVLLPSFQPAIVTWQGRFFHNEGGRYVEAQAFASTEAPR